MHLYLSSPSALNSFYSTETSRPLYKVETPLISVGETRRTIIRRAVDTVDGVWLGEKGKKSDSEDLNNALISYVQTRCVSPTSTTTRSSSDSRNDGTFEGHFAHLAHIEYALLKSSRILYAGHELRTDKLFQSKGWSWYGMSRHKVFCASDGCEYRWVINSKYPKLVSNDSSKTVIARFHRAKSSFSLRPDLQQRPSLEIYPEGEHILDDILVTFVYLRDAEEN